MSRKYFVSRPAGYSDTYVVADEVVIDHGCLIFLRDKMTVKAFSLGMWLEMGMEY